jgi:hypothetical protein
MGYEHWTLSSNIITIFDVNIWNYWSDLSFLQYRELSLTIIIIYKIDKLPLIHNNQKQEINVFVLLLFF